VERFTKDFVQLAARRLAKETKGKEASRVMEYLFDYQRTRVDDDFGEQSGSSRLRPFSFDGHGLAAFVAEESAASARRGGGGNSRRRPGDSALDVRAALARLAAEPLPLIRAARATDIDDGAWSGGNYCLDLRDTLNCLVEDTVDSIIMEKFGEPSKRIFRLLLSARYLESKEISSMVLVAEKEVRQRLFALFSAGFLKLQEVPKRSDHSPQTTFYVWGINQTSLSIRLSDNVHKSILNMRLRRESEWRAHEELIERHQRRLITSERDKKKFLKLGGMLRRLDAAVLQLDDTNMLLVDFDSVLAIRPK
jgi:hypothetical protein